MAICKDDLTAPLPIRYAAGVTHLPQQPGSTPAPLTLQQLTVGEHARVTGYARGDRALRDKLLSFGLTRGAEVTIVRTAPAGCPVELRVRDMSVVLRRSEAAGLHVERMAGGAR